MEDIGLRGESKGCFGKMNGPSEEQMGDRMVSDSVGSTSGPLLCNKPQSYLGKTLPWKGSVTTEFLSEGLSLGRWGEFRESLSLHWLLFKCLQFKITNMPKDGGFCCPSSLKQEKVKKNHTFYDFS